MVVFVFRVRYSIAIPNSMFKQIKSKIKVTLLCGLKLRSKFQRIVDNQHGDPAGRTLVALLTFHSTTKVRMRNILKVPCQVFF